MKTVKIDLPQDLDEIKLHIFADWHIGDKGCNIAAIKEEIKAVQENPNAYVICNGDLMNNATKTSVSDCYSEVLTPQEQIDKLVELLTPVKDKILIFTQGNHEARTFRNDGIDLTSIVASNLDLLDRYCREGGILFLRFGLLSRKKSQKTKVSYSLYVTHGSGGGRKEGAKAIRLADLACTIDADVYIHAHTHLPMIMKEDFFRIDLPNSTFRQVEKLFVNSAAKLGYGGYGQSGGFKPSSISNPVIYLSGHIKKAVAKL